jgi:hypothetical protein
VPDTERKTTDLQIITFGLRSAADQLRPTDRTLAERQYREQEVQARYRTWERDVIDPFAISLLHAIVAELEADLDKNREEEVDVALSNLSTPPLNRADG